MSVIIGLIVWAISLLFADTGQERSKPEFKWPEFNWPDVPLTDLIGPIIVLGFFVTCLFFVLGIARLILGIIRPPFADRSWLRQLPDEEKTSYSEIETALDVLQTIGGKRRYLSRLDKKVVRVRGNWSGGTPPKTGSDELDSLLAQMEERWIGLAR